MKFARSLLVMLLALFLPALVVAQHASLSGSVVSFMGPNGSAPATVADGYVNVTQVFSIGYQQIVIPGLASAKLGMGAFDKPLSSWVGKTLTKKFVFDASKIDVTLLFGAGKLNESIANVNRIAETAGLCVSYPIAANVSAKVVCAQWLHGGIVNGAITSGIPSAPGTVSSSSSTAAVSSGIKVHW